MKIAILTLPLHTNYGGILQCYALQTILHNMGHDVKILTKPQYGFSYYWIYPLSICKRLIKRYVLNKENVDILRAPHEIIRRNTDKFIKQYIHQYKCRNWTTNISNKFDVIVVGSDQIWRPEYSQPIEYAFLSFLVNTDIKRISYAASFGVDYCEYTDEQKKVCSSLLKKFDAISVRELSGVNLCYKNFGVKAVQVLDPTLLLSADDYRVLVNKVDTELSKGNMLVYIIDKTEEKIALVNRIASDKGLIPFWLDSPDDQNENFPLKERVKMSVEQWLKSFDDAEFIFTDSFHGCIFSIIFRKQFLAIGNKQRGLDRFISLLEQFSLKERLILSSNEYEKKMPLINYNKLQGKLSILQKQSILFLKTNLLKI